MFSPEAIQSAKLIPLPETDEHDMTDYDKEVWNKAFDWYNRTFNPELPYKLTCRGCYLKVYLALKKAKEQ